MLKRVYRYGDGSYRIAASKLLPGKVLGGFRYHGTRPDDPNDIVPHEHRRELRALKVFGAWTNLTDMKAGNTIDTLVTDERGRKTVRHWLQDVGSTFGIGANGQHDWWEGWEPLYSGGVAWKRIYTLGFYLSPWQTADYEKHDSIGIFEGKEFDPESWKPRSLPGAFLAARDDDNFWAARRVVAFTDEMIRTVVKAARFNDPAAEKLLADVLIARRDKIGQAYLPKINPIVDVALDPSGVLTFANAAVDARVAEPPTGGYQRGVGGVRQRDRAGPRAGARDEHDRHARAGAVRTADHGRHLHPCGAERRHARHRVLGETGACVLQANRRILEARGIRAADGTGRA